MQRLPVFLLLWFSLVTPPALASRLKVKSYNVGLAHYGLIDLVPCRGTRRPLIVETIINSIQDDPSDDEHAVLLQEAWDYDFFEAIKYHALKRGLDVQPRDYAHVENNGLIAISTLPIKDWAFESFGQDIPTIERGILRVDIEWNGANYKFFNTHTVFSGLQGLSDIHLWQLQGILNHLATIPEKRAILVGDFNFGNPFLVNGQKHAVMELSHAQWKDELTYIGYEPVKTKGYTWDASRNVLISYPTFWLELYTLFTGGSEWKQVQSSIDQIWFGSAFRLKSSQLVYTESFDSWARGPSHCPGDQWGLTPLSDHFGVEAVFEAN